MNRGVVLPAPKAAVQVEELPVPHPAPGEVLLRMEACGVCHSDLFIAGMEKPPVVPLVLGHEGIGRVEAVGEGVTSFAKGDRAGVTFLASSCGSCELCRTGRERFCARQLNTGYTTPGVLAELVSVAAQHLVRVPLGLSAADVAPMCCAGWTAYRAVKETGLQAGATIAIFGMGGLGHLAVQFARHAGLHVAAVDVAEDKLQLAREVGAEITVKAENAGRTLQKECGGVDGAVVVTGSPAAAGQALRSLKRCGTAVLVGMAQGPAELPIVDTILKGITIRGSYLGARADLEEVFRLSAAGVARAHVEAYGIGEAPQAFQRLHQGEVAGRAVISF